MNQEKTKNVLEKIRQSKLKEFKNYQEIGGDYVKYHIQKIYAESDGTWDDRRSQEYINSLAAEEGLRELMDPTVEEY
jgi:hypothetical protein